MKVITSVSAMQAEAESLRRAGKRIAVVPTMGYLHRGHTSLIEDARKRADVVVVTVFVNPTQFAPHEDYARYPRDFDRDRRLSEEAGADIVFHPEVGEMYPEGYQTFVEVSSVSEILEGAVRPAHFRGVATVVAKLFLATKPHVAVFGQKDAQQAFIVRRMVRDLNIDVEIIVAPIVREDDGLALSSRNVYLTPSERQRATVLFRSLRRAEERIRAGDRSVGSVRREMMKILQSGEPTGVDYVAFVAPATFQEIQKIEPPGVLIALAVRFGTTRLIDNTLIQL